MKTLPFGYCPVTPSFASVTGRGGTRTGTRSNKKLEKEVANSDVENNVVIGEYSSDDEDVLKITVPATLKSKAAALTVKESGRNDVNPDESREITFVPDPRKTSTQNQAVNLSARGDTASIGTSVVASQSTELR